MNKNKKVKRVAARVHNENYYSELPCITITKRKTIQETVIEEVSYEIKGFSLDECYTYYSELKRLEEGKTNDAKIKEAKKKK